MLLRWKGKEERTAQKAKLSFIAVSLETSVDFMWSSQTNMMLPNCFQWGQRDQAFVSSCWMAISLRLLLEQGTIMGKALVFSRGDLSFLKKNMGDASQHPRNFQRWLQYLVWYLFSIVIMHRFLYICVYKHINIVCRLIFLMNREAKILNKTVAN